jgi:hypothetical protein
MKKAQALLLDNAGPALRAHGARLVARLRAWAAAPRRRSPLRYSCVGSLAPWAPHPRGPGRPAFCPGRAFLPRAPRRRRSRLSRRPAAAVLRLTLVGGAGGLGTSAPLGLPRRMAPSPLGALAWGPFKRR